MNFDKRVEYVVFHSAFRRVLAKDITALESIPRHDTSHMDGYAVNSKDIANASKTSPVVLSIKRKLLLPGSSSKQALVRGEALSVATGTRIPEGADAVIPLEQVEVVNRSKRRLIDRRIAVQKPLPSGAFVYPTGADIQKGETLLSKGSILRAQDLGLLASLGTMEVHVIAKPRIAIIPTGDEITDDISETSNDLNSEKRGKTLNSNSHVLARIIEDAGAESFYAGIAPDDAGAIAMKIKEALETCEMVITLGGSSAGKFDLVKNAINSLEKAGMIAHGIKVDRGRVTGAGIVERKPVIMLPGPIQGAMSGFIALALPLIQEMSGATDVSLRVPAMLTKEWRARKRFPNFMKVVYVSLSHHNGQFKAEPLHAESESVKILVRANGYILVPESVTGLAANQNVEVNLLSGLSF